MRLLLEKPTLYRKRDVGNQRSIVTDCAESDRLAYQQNFLEQTHKFDCQTSQKPEQELYFATSSHQGRSLQHKHSRKKVNKLSNYFHSLITPQEPFNIKDIEPTKPPLTNFSIPKRNQREILLTFDNEKARGPDRLPSIFRRLLLPGRNPPRSFPERKAFPKNTGHLENCGCFPYFEERRQTPSIKLPTGIAFKHCRQNLRKMHLPVLV